MTRRVADIAAELGITEDKVRELIAGLGLRVGKTASKVNDDVAGMVLAKAAGKPVDASAVTTNPAARRAPARRTGNPRSAGAITALPEEAEPVASDKKLLALPPTLTVKDFAERMHLKVTIVITALMKSGVLATINDTIDYDTASIIASDLGFEATEEAVEETGVVDSSQLRDLLAHEAEETLSLRAPVISVIGHVDHGKTSLLDAIRGTVVASGEAGGITQRIGAYQITHKGKPITFLDTPGHEAFSAMRARGVRSTDVAILVVAADDGVKPQTIEAITHAHQANVPIVVAISKIDKPGANTQRVRQQLAEHSVLVEGYGGTTVVAEVSAKTRQGLDDLLDMILLVTEMENLRANPNRPAIASVIESRLDPNLGAVASVLVHTGTLHLRDKVVVGSAYGRVKLLRDFTGASVLEAGPSMPVLLVGLSSVPRAGDVLQAVETEQEARAIAAAAVTTAQQSRASLLADVTSHEEGNAKEEYRIVIKGDLRGSLEAIKSSVERLVSDTVQVKIVHLAVGDVTDSDVLLAAASHADLYAFNVRVPMAMVRRADAEGITLRSFDVIYKLVEEVESHLNAMLAPERIETPLGRMKLLKIFFRGKGECVAGGDVTKGVVKPKSHARIFRGENLIGEGEIEKVQRGPESVHEAQQGEQCGVRFVGNVKLLEGDILEISMVELRTRTVSKAPSAPTE